MQAKSLKPQVFHANKVWEKMIESFYIWEKNSGIYFIVKIGKQKICLNRTDVVTILLCRKKLILQLLKVL